jgi:F-type H+-transporting ATPase subunit a
MDPMSIQDITPDQLIYWRWGILTLNATILYTWITIVLITLLSWWSTRSLTSEFKMSRWQNIMEVLVGGINNQIREVSQQDAERYLPFIGTLFLFIVISNTLAIVPGYTPPTGSLSTTAALAICVFVAVPIYGISRRGLAGYFKQYVQPTFFMLPFNIIGELSRTLALAVRLFGNIMSGGKIVAILLAVAPLLFPVVMQILGILVGIIQAYIFAILAMVYIASATRVQEGKSEKLAKEEESK